MFLLGLYHVIGLHENYVGDHKDDIGVISCTRMGGLEGLVYNPYISRTASRFCEPRPARCP